MNRRYRVDRTWRITARNAVEAVERTQGTPHEKVRAQPEQDASDALWILSSCKSTLERLIAERATGDADAQRLVDSIAQWLDRECPEQLDVK